MSLQRLGFKFFLRDDFPLQIKNFIPLFHSWIQQQLMEEHLLIDVHDYSHVFTGPGILLAAHEGNFSVDLSGNRPGLLYYRKQAVNQSLRERIETIFRTTLLACHSVEDSDHMPDLKFKTDEFLMIANDRLLAPNTSNTFQQIKPDLSEFMTHLLGNGNFTLTHCEDSRERFSVLVETPSSLGTLELLNRLS